MVGTTRPTPVQRGAWVLENLLGMKPPSPPPGVETNLDGEGDASKAKTIRERMELHRSNPVCASCHNIMDPVGFSLENFDLVGKWREMDGKTRIDATAEMVDGTKLNGPAALRRALLDRSNSFVSVATEKLMTYATGRAVTPYDMPAVRKLFATRPMRIIVFHRLCLAWSRANHSRCGQETANRRCSHEFHHQSACNFSNRKKAAYSATFNCGGGFEPPTFGL
jgi:hypothetical protein